MGSATINGQRLELTLHRQFFTPNFNAIFRKYYAAIAGGKILTLLHTYGKVVRIFIVLIFLQFFRSCCITSVRHATYRKFDVRRQHNNFLKLRCNCELKIARVSPDI